jgi:hypothetical protein
MIYRLAMCSGTLLMNEPADSFNVCRKIQISYCCSCRQHLSAKGTSAICSGRSSGFRINPILRLPMSFEKGGRVEKGVRNQSSGAPCGPFGYWFLTPFSNTLFQRFTVDRCRISPRLQRRDRDGILMIDISHRLPFSLAPVLFGVKLTPHNTREHLNSVN